MPTIVARSVIASRNSDPPVKIWHIQPCMERPAVLGSRRTACPISRDIARMTWSLLCLLAGDVATVAINTSIASPFTGRKARICGAVIYTRRSFGFRTTMASWLVSSWATLFVVVVVSLSCPSCSLLPPMLLSELISYPSNVYQKFGRRFNVIFT